MWGTGRNAGATATLPRLGARRIRGCVCFLCCTTNCHRLSGWNNTHLLSHTLWLRSLGEHGVDLTLCKADIMVSARLGSIWQSDWQWVCFQARSGRWQIQSWVPCRCKTEAQVLLTVGQRPCSACFCKASKNAISYTLTSSQTDGPSPFPFPGG